MPTLGKGAAYGRGGTHIAYFPGAVTIAGSKTQHRNAVVIQGTERLVGPAFDGCAENVTQCHT